MGLRRRTLPLRLYFGLLFALVVLGAGAGVVYVNGMADAEARAKAERDGSFSARAAADQVDSHVANLKATTAQLAVNPQIAAALTNPIGCTLSFQGLGGPAAGHLDIIRADGTVACSSKPIEATPRGYAESSWLGRALRQPAFVAPVRDARTDSQVAIASTPIPGGKGVVAAFADLPTLGRYLAAQYGGGRPTVFLLATDGDRVVSRSEDPERWIGEPVPNGRDHHLQKEWVDLEGNERLYAAADVPAAGWHLYVGEQKAAVLASVASLRDGQLRTIAVSLLLFLLGAGIVYRRVAVPIRRLSRQVRSATSTAAPVAVSGPSEVRALAEDVNRLVASVRAELAERRRAEAAARASEESYRQLFESNPSPMYVYDLETLRFVAVNDAALETYGYARDEFIGMPIEQVIVPAEADRLRQAVDEVTSGRNGGRVHWGVWRHRRRDGSELSVEVTADDHVFEGRPARVAVAVDVTDRERLEEQLRQAQRLEAVGQLAGGVAHDFNNLLTVIGGFAETLLDGRERAAEPELDQILLAAERATVLTRQLLAFSRRQVLQPRVLDLNAVVDGLAPMLTRLIGDNVELDTLLEPELAPVLADPGQLEQVIVNLAVNARDAMARGGRLTMQTANVDLDEDYVAHHGDVTAGPHVMLSIRDTGHGMDAETLAHVFEPFFTTKPVGTGTGLGLATVYGIVKQSGGNIWIYSEPGEGTTLKIYFPQAEATVPEEDASTRPAVTVARGTETILVAEDEPSLRALSARILEKHGYEVITAESAPDALRIVESNGRRFDLLLTDLIMPELSGPDLAERVQRLVPGIRVLFMSGYADDVMTKNGSLEPGAPFLEKPFTANGLAAKVRELLDQPR